MTSLFMKVILCPLIVAMASYILPNVNFTSMFQPILIGLVLAGVGTAMEYLILKRGTLWISTFLDFVASILIIVGLAAFLDGAEVTILGAIIVSLFLAFTEYFTHLFLIRSDKTEKSPA